MGDLFFRIYSFLHRNKIASGIAFLILLLAMGFVASQISFEEDISKLIPINDDNREVQKVLKTVNFTDKIIVNIQRSDSASLEDLKSYATDLVDSLESRSGEYIKYIRGKVKEDDLQRTMDFVYNNLPLFLEEKDYKTIADKLEKDSIAATTQANYRSLISPSGIVTKDLILRDPLGISFIGLRKLRQLGISDDFYLKDGFLVSMDERNILLFITPFYPSSETGENSKFVEQLEDIQQQLAKKYQGKVSNEYFGAAIIAVGNAAQIKKDTQFTVGITFSLLILIFILVYRKIYVPLILFTPTFFGGLLALVTLYLLRSEISAISLGIGSVLMGVTLDYSLHIITHIRNNETVENLYKDVTEPILMSSLTTSLAFLCLLFVDSQALQDLGIFAAASVLGAASFALLFIPLVYKNPTTPHRRNTILDKLAAYEFHKKKGLLAFIVVALIISAFAHKNVTFNKDISQMNFESQASKTAMKNLDELTDISSKSIYLATYGKSVEGTLQLNDSIQQKLESLKQNQEIGSFSSIGALVQSQKDQREKIKLWREFWTTDRKENTESDLIESSGKLGFKPKTFNRFYGLLDANFKTLEPEDYQQIPSMLLEDYINTEADFTTITTLIKLNQDNAAEIKAAFKTMPNTLVIDRQAMNESFLGNLKSDFNHLIIYCILAVLLILFLFFRSIILTLVTISSIALTWFLTMGVMGLLHIEFNIFNIIISTFVFGLGIDYSIFMTKGLLKELRTGEKVMPTHKTSIILSVLSTILGIGVLIFAKHPALYSISIVSIIGISSAMFMSFTIQPLLFRLFMGSKNRRPINIRMSINSVLSFFYFGLGGILLSLYSVTIMRILPVKPETNSLWFHKMISKFMGSVLYSNPFVKKHVINEVGEDFSKPAVIIANHTSFLDIIAIGILNPKICFLVNDWVYNSPVFGKAVQRADFYPVSLGIENSLEHLQKKVDNGYSLMAFPEGSRSTTNKIKRFHKGAFYLAEQLDLDVLPILIHGNSEVNPKGSLIVNDGTITLNILKRIKPNDITYGENYTQRAKVVGEYFREEFFQLRRQIEGPEYFHQIVLEEYRYKGNKLYANVKRDLKEHAEDYFNILSEVKKKAHIVHFSNGMGQLDYLLALDSPDRTIHSFVEDEEVRIILQNSFITQQYNRLEFMDSFQNATLRKTDVLIISSDLYNAELSEKISNLHIEKIIILNSITTQQIDSLIDLGYQNVIQASTISIFKLLEQKH